MSIGDIRQNKLMSLAAHGYNPFQPDLGIMCGGYPGPLYPNPTTLIYPGFDPYLYINPTPTIYTPDIDYTGLGVGNPGIDYKNPGHILGLLDTFSRMSYGIAMWNNIYAGNDIDGGFSPVVNIEIPFIDMENEDGTYLKTSDIYPSLSEIPTDWVNSFEILSNGRVVPDPRPLSAFVTYPANLPSFTTIDEDQFYRLFNNKTVLSYIGMPQYLREVIANMYEYARTMDEQVELPFTIPDEEAADFNFYSDQASWHTDLPENYKGERNSKGKMFIQCKSLDPTNALKVLTGSDEYHDGDGELNDYRSLTELNSVVNLLPAQMVGAQFWTDTKGYMESFSPIGGWSYYVGPETGRTFTYTSYMIVDFVINVSDLPINFDDPESGEVTINGEAIIRSPISDPTSYYYTESSTWFFSPAHVPPHDPIEYNNYEYGCGQSLKKTARINMSMKNKFGWDSRWLGNELSEDQHSEFDEFEDVATEGGIVPGVGFITCDQSDLIVPFDYTFVLAAGCTAIRLRAYLQNRHSIDMIPAPLFNPFSPGPYSPGPGITYIITNSGPIGDPDSVPNNLVSSNIEFSFSVVGTNMNNLSYEFSIGGSDIE